MKKFGLIGHPLTHSVSPFIHKRLFELRKTQAEYKLYDIAELDKKSMDLLRSLDGFNVTIPHKEKIIELIDFIDADAQRYMAINTVKNAERGMQGHNTDVYGLEQSLLKLNVKKMDKVLILGAGGAAAMAAALTAQKASQITLAARKKSAQRAKDLASRLKERSKAQILTTDIEDIKGEYDLMINCTPVGMYPKAWECPVSEGVIKNCAYVVDLIYNPLKTELVKRAERLGIPGLGGMAMLVYQAAKAQDIWFDDNFSEQAPIEQIIEKAEKLVKNRFQKNVVVFTGFMASGKSAVAQAFCRKYGYELADTDDIIALRENMSVKDIFESKGEKYFREKERMALQELINRDKIAISAGGGAAAHCADLLEYAFVVFVNTPFEVCYERIKKQGDKRPLANAKDKLQLKELYDERYPVYKETAHMEIDGSQDMRTILSTFDTRLQ